MLQTDSYNSYTINIYTINSSMCSYCYEQSDMIALLLIYILQIIHFYNNTILNSAVTTSTECWELQIDGYSYQVQNF